VYIKNRYRPAQPAKSCGGRAADMYPSFEVLASQWVSSGRRRISCFRLLCRSREWLSENLIQSSEASKGLGNYLHTFKPCSELPDI
jgi:hypothetical protein